MCTIKIVKNDKWNQSRSGTLIEILLWVKWDGDIITCEYCNMDELEGSCDMILQNIVHVNQK